MQDNSHIWPGLPCKRSELELFAKDICLRSAGRVELKRKKDSRNWLLFVNNTFVQELRNARAMSFMDGWMASDRFNRPVVNDESISKMD